MYSSTLSTARLIELLHLARSKRIVVIGDVMLDVYVIGDVERISPEAPVPIVRIRERKYATGGAANVAQNVVAIGAACEVIAITGDDDGGTSLRRMLEAMNIGFQVSPLPNRRTTIKTRIVARNQQVVRVDDEEDADLEEHLVDQLLGSLDRTIADADALVLEDYNKGVLTPRVIRAAIDCAVARGIPIIVDPKFRNFFQYAGATIFKPNRRELEAALGAAVDLDHPETLPALCDRLQVAHLLLTLGEHGMVLFSAEGEVSRIPTTARDVFDVVGAGDTVTAYLATMLACGASVGEAAVIANLAAGVEVSKRGAASVSGAELLAHIAAFPVPPAVSR